MVSIALGLQHPIRILAPGHRLLMFSKLVAGVKITLSSALRMACGRAA